jgi:membrane-associated phospholipid phosphatase
MNITNDLSWVPALRTPELNVFFDWVTLIGYPLFLILFLLFGYFFFQTKSFYRATILLMGAGLLNALLKDFFQDPRPAAEFALDPRTGGSYGWPSGHAQIAVVLWGFLAYEIRQGWATIGAIVLIALICASRVYLGVHDLGDVFGGLVLGILCLAGFIWALHHATVQGVLARLGDGGVVAALLAVHVAYIGFYPAHLDHAAPVWFVGSMLGWVIARAWMAHGEVVLPGPLGVRFLLASAATGLGFVWMIVTTRWPESLALEGLAGIGLTYAAGVAFAVIMGWGVPRLIGLFARG